MEAVAGTRTITLPGHLSGRAEPLAALARECYPDMAVLVDRSREDWLVRLAPVGELTRVWDPGISAVLAASNVVGSDLMSWHRLYSVGRTVWLEAMYHSWALVAWSKWLQFAGDVRPLILHVARTHDLGAPALLCGASPTLLLGIMEDLEIELIDPATVRNAVKQGFIGVGSYMTPLLRAMPGDLVHLAPANRANMDPTHRLRFDVDASPWHAYPRLEIRGVATGSCSYRQIGDPALLVDEWTPTQPVLLDIDLAYFDVVPKRRREPLGASCSVSELIEGVQPMAAAIAAVTVSYSPGACPSAKWATLAAELRAALSPLLGASIDIEAEGH
jgi:hypothetical protein